MRVLLDQGTPFRAAERLRDAEWDALHLREVGLSTADADILLARAADENRIIITFDADFHRLLPTTGATAPSVVRIRMQGLSYEEFAALLQRELLSRAELLQTGAAVSITAKGVRIRLLPLPFVAKG